MENDNNGFENTNQQNTYGQPEANQNVYGQPDASQQFTGAQNTYSQADANQTYQQQTYGQPYQQYAGGNFNGQGFNANYGQGGAPLDKKGQPLKNRFGMKLTFAILEIICCNLISLICGIIACVNTSKANTSYKEARWDDFKSQAKTATICLWIGFGGVILQVIAIIVCVVLFMGIAQGTLSNMVDSDYASSYAYEYEDEYDSNYDTDDEIEAEPETEVAAEPATEATTETAEPAQTTEIIPGEGFTTPSLTVDGISITLPLDYTDLKAMGFSVSEEDEAYIINKEEYTYPDVMNAKGEEIGYIYVGNVTDAPIAVSEGLVYGFVFYLDEWQDAKADFVLYNGVTAATTEEQLLTAFGTPDYEYHSDDSDYASYEWYNHNDEYYDTSYNSIDFTYSDGAMSEMCIEYIGW